MNLSATFIPATKHFGGPLHEVVRLAPNAPYELKQRFRENNIPLNQQMTVKSVEMFEHDTSDNFGHKLHNWQDKGDFEKGQIIYLIQHEYNSLWVAEGDLEVKVPLPSSL